MDTAMMSVIIYSLWPFPFPRFIVLFFLASQVLQQSEQSKGYQPSSPYSATFCTAAQLPFPRAFYPSLTIHIGIYAIATFHYSSCQESLYRGWGAVPRLIVLNPDQATSRLDYKHLKWPQTHARCTPVLFPVRTAKHKKLESTFPAIIMSRENKNIVQCQSRITGCQGID